MNRKQFISYLEEHKIPYNESGLYEGYDGVYVYSKRETNMKKAHPRKYKNLFVPYLRVSHFGEEEGRAYVRDCGLCEWRNWDRIIMDIKALGA